MRQKLSVLLVALMAIVAAAPLSGQDVPKDQQAEIAIELDMKKLRNNALYGSVRSNVENLASQADVPDGLNLEDVDTVFVAVALPDGVTDFAALQQVPAGADLPMDMFIRVKFNDSAAVDKLMEKAAADSVEREIGGKKVYSPPASEGPSNIAVYRADSTTIEFGTDNYIKAGIGNHLLSPGLKSAWDKMPDQALRIAMDLENPSDLVSQAVTMAKQNADPMAGGFIELINKVSDIRITMDLDAGNLLTIMANGKDEKSASELQMGLDGILAMGKMGGAQAVQALKEQDENAAKVVKAILDSLSAKQDGTEVQIVIPKPDGFEDAVQNMIQNQMGGAGF